ALAGREAVGEAEIAAACRLVLAPRATRLPAPPPSREEEQAAEPPPPPSETGREDEPGEPDLDALTEIAVAALAAAIPPDLLAGLRLGQGGRSRGGAGSGAQGRSLRSGRPVGARRGDPRRGARLDLLATVTAAAPWQRLRRPAGDARLAVRRDDLRVKRFKRRQETTTIFVVDASGSAALHRMAEAKGAVERLLAECYVRRDRAALIAFRGQGAEILLPPTRSLARAKRSLAALPGGGGTPLAAAIDGAFALADTTLRAGGSALVVFLTDGRANVARDGTTGREPATRDAELAARRLRASPARSLVIDTAPRPGEAARTLAAALDASYVALPVAASGAIAAVVAGEIAAGPRGRAAGRAAS
ncbi:MAG: VWA domain-containing protein, partial [Methylobacteriaceae bacterium]|nr:VWA domain-containing protein [Methylobacteriaceae bacterium]